MILTLKMVKLSVNLYDAALNDMMKTVNCFDIRIISVILVISTNSSRSFVVPAVICFSTIRSFQLAFENLQRTSEEYLSAVCLFVAGNTI